MLARRPFDREFLRVAQEQAHGMLALHVGPLIARDVVRGHGGCIGGADPVDQIAKHFVRFPVARGRFPMAFPEGLGVGIPHGR
jgi:hypothetical protein